MKRVCVCYWCISRKYLKGINMRNIKMICFFWVSGILCTHWRHRSLNTILSNSLSNCLHSGADSFYTVHIIGINYKIACQWCRCSFRYTKKTYFDSLISIEIGVEVDESKNCNLIHLQHSNNSTLAIWMVSTWIHKISLLYLINVEMINYKFEQYWFLFINNNRNWYWYSFWNLSKLYIVQKKNKVPNKKNLYEFHLIST